MKHFGLQYIFLFLVACTPNQSSAGADSLLLYVGRGGFIDSFLPPPVYVLSIDGTGEVPANLPSRLGRTPRWSADGHWIVFMDFARDDGTHIHFMRSDGSRHIEHQPHPRANRDPVWSPDGKRIAYFGYDGRKPGILMLDVECLLNGERCQPQQVFLAEGDLPDWSPDGKQIAYIHIDDTFTNHIYVINADGSDQPRMLTPNIRHCFRPRWSPTGDKIAFSCDASIYVINADGSGLTKLTEPGSFPTWSPDGSKIAFLSGRDGLGKCIGGICGSSGIYSNAVFLMDTDGSNVIRLGKRDDEQVFWYTWLPKPNLKKP